MRLPMLRPHDLPRPLTSLIILSLSRLACSVSLSDFQPSIDTTTLISNCATIYISPIPGCQPNDFSGASPVCSSQCIAGMLSMTSDIFNACAGSQSSDQGILGAFLIGRGVGNLCPNAVVTTIRANGGLGTSVSISGMETTTSVPLSTTTDSGETTTTTSTPSPVSYGDSTTSSPTSTTSPDSTTTSTSTTSTSTTSDSKTTTTSHGPSTSTSSTTSSTPSNTNNHPPSGLPTDGVLPAPSRSHISSDQPVDCVPNGGGGSLIGGNECPESAASTLQVMGSRWLVAGFALLLGARNTVWWL